MRQVIKQRQLVADDWFYSGKDEAGAAAAQRVALPLSEYLAVRAGAPPAATLAVWLAPADEIDGLLPWLQDLPLIAVEFTSSGEGRGYSQARLLRERHGFKGELRAIGAVRVDQIYFLARCGFDAFDLAAGENPQLAIEQLHRFSVAYQDSTGALVHPRRRYGASSSQNP